MIKIELMMNELQLRNSCTISFKSVKFGRRNSTSGAIIFRASLSQTASTFVYNAIVEMQRVARVRVRQRRIVIISVPVQFMLCWSVDTDKPVSRRISRAI